MVVMNVQGVTQTTNILPPYHVMPQSPAAQQVNAGRQAQETAPVADAISVSMAASIQVMDMAQSAYEDAASELIASMAAATGIGQNVDITV